MLQLHLHRCVVDVVDLIGEVKVSVDEPHQRTEVRHLRQRQHFASEGILNTVAPHVDLALDAKQGPHGDQVGAAVGLLDRDSDVVDGREDHRRVIDVAIVERAVQLVDQLAQLDEHLVTGPRRGCVRGRQQGDRNHCHDDSLGVVPVGIRGAVVRDDLVVGVDDEEDGDSHSSQRREPEDDGQPKVGVLFDVHPCVPLSLGPRGHRGR